MKTIKLLATITVTDDYFIDDPYWTLENAVSESFEEEELKSVEIYEPPVIDVDLEKEIKDTCRGYRINESHEQELGKQDIENIARYFYKLGFNTRK